MNRPARETFEVVVVDPDRERARETVEELVRTTDRVSAQTVPDDSAAVARIREESVDCVVAEHVPGVLDAVAFLRDVREVRPGLPVVLFTGAGDERLASEAISAGVTDYVRRTGDRQQYDTLRQRVAPIVGPGDGSNDPPADDADLFAAVAGIADVGAWAYDPDEEQLQWSERVYEIHGRDPGEPVDPAAALSDCHPEDRSKLRAAFEHPVDSRERYENTLRIESGDGIRCVEVRAEPVVRGEEVVRVHGTVADVTERREKTRALRRERSLVDAIFEQIPAHLFVKDEEGRHLRVSDHFTSRQKDERIEDGRSGLQIETYTPDSLIGKRDIDISDSDHARAAFEDDMHVIETGEPILGKEEYSADEDEWNLTSKMPWRNEDGEVIGLIGISQRITERKRTEQRLQRQNERLDEFASVVSHDLRNPLNVASGQLELARADCDSEHLDAVARAHERMATLIDDLLALTREGDPASDPDSVDLAELARESWAGVPMASATLRVATERTVRAREPRLRQLLENLFRNCVEHGGGSVTIGDTADGFYVADDGPGIPPAERDQVFESGYTTTSDGTGYGLTIVQDVAAAHGWDVTVTESDCGGARFEITGVTTDQ